jgi:hypothetical protein
MPGIETMMLLSSFSIRFQIAIAITRVINALRITLIAA